MNAIRLRRCDGQTDAQERKGFFFEKPAPMTRSAAKKHITDENYTDVTNLLKVKDGWTAKAESLGAPVSLLLTDRGDIDQQ